MPASGETAEDISIASVVVKPGILLGGDLNIVSPTTEYDSAFLARDVVIHFPNHTRCLAWDVRLIGNIDARSDRK